ncbi:MAG: nicotinate phosphoribosyltransferase [Lachnospiraceae bacterium]|nr:nicotinate phosphoribosyltransferase [Lachnospiraceae bacterium]
MNTQFNERNISMVMDMYELTMSNGYLNKKCHNTMAAFDVFYRTNPDNAGFAIFAGLEQVIEYIQNLHFGEEDIAYLRSRNLFTEEFLDYLLHFEFQGDIYAMPEGTIMYPNEPVMTVVAPMIDAQLIETAVLLQINHQSLIATKTNRIVRAANGKPVSDFGARRAHNVDAAVYGARAAYIGGAVGTATVLAGQMFNIPISGTMAHSWVMCFDNEYEAFKAYAESYPDSTVLLADTYDVLKSGVPNAIRIAKEVLGPMGKRLKGIRLDSGDLAYLSKEARKQLDEAGLHDCIIVASNSLDEYTITSLNRQEARIDSYGVGEKLITSYTSPVFGAVYKLAAINKDGNFAPKIKISETIEKITNPGLKEIYRVYDKEGKAIADYLTVKGEEIDTSHPVRYVDPKHYWKDRSFSDCTFKPLQKQIFKGGELVYELPSLEEIRSYVRNQLECEIWKEEQRFENAHPHYLDMSPAMFELKMGLLHESSASDNA